MKFSLKILFFVLLFSLLASMVSCQFVIGGSSNTGTPGDETPGAETEGNGTENDETDNEEENKVPEKAPTNKKNLYLFWNGNVQFQVVYASMQSSAVMHQARALVASLRQAGYEVPDPVSDTDKDAIADCEILIGANIRNRGEECAINDKKLGENGQLVKVVGNRLVIAGGTTEMTLDALDDFLTRKMNISGEIDPYFSIPRDYVHELLTTYEINSIKVKGLDFSNYTIILDLANFNYDKTIYNELQSKIYAKSGCWLNYGNIINIDSYTHRFIIRYCDYAGDDGFRVYMDGDDFIVECAYSNCFNKTFENFVDKYLLGFKGDVNFTADYQYSENVSVVYYEDYGAKGDGITDDFDAILAAHEFANQSGQLVTNRTGANAHYYIGDKFITQIPVKTDVDFNGAKFTVDDTVQNAYATRKCGLFKLIRDNADVRVNERTIKELNGGELPEVRIGDTSLPWLAPILTDKCLVEVVNQHYDFIRHGANQSKGRYRTDMLIVYPDGTISEDTPIYFDFVAGEQTNHLDETRVYNSLYYLNLFNTNDKPITMKNGTFVNICCKVRAETDFKNVFHEYRRGLEIFRSNVTIENLKHYMQDEPVMRVAADGAEFGNYGDCAESYPYYGFFYICNTHNLLIKDSVITGHSTYYEDKPETATTGGVKPNPVPMGTYDFVVEYSSNVTFDNVVQAQVEEDGGMTDTKYWGVMSSNGSKNLNFYNCHINRFDAHRGFWNATLKDTTISIWFHLVGGGKLYCENVTKTAGDSYVTVRGDYGALFNGDIELVDCTHLAEKTYTSRTATKPTSLYGSIVIYKSSFTTNADINDPNSYWNWDFGFPCEMAKTITIDNFKCAKTLYVFNNLPDVIFKTVEEGGIKNTHIITEKVIFRNMDTIPKMCSGKATTYTKLNEIEVVNEGKVTKNDD